MNPVVIAGHEAVAGQPPDWDDSQGPCHGLPLRLDREGDLLFMRSAWQPTDVELAQLVAGATIELGISAPQHPVVQLGVGPIPHDPDIPTKPVFILREMTDAAGQRMMRAVVVVGEHSFPAGVKIREGEPVPIAAMRLLKLLDDHMRSAGILT